VPEIIPGPPPVAEIEETARYGVITGSFKSEENARSHIAILKAEGYDPEMIAGTNGFFRVIAMTCGDLETAVLKKDSVSKEFPGAWVSKR